MLGARKSVRLGLGALLSCAVAGDAAAGLLGPSEHNRFIRSVDHRQMVFFVAKGPADSCGPGCNEWIAAVGSIDKDAAQRFREFLKNLNGRKLPIYFHSLGGLGGPGFQIGQILRERRMTAGVGRTEARCNPFEKKDTACQSKLKAGESIAARLVTQGGVCASACVYALAGGSTRHIAPGVSIGVHASGTYMLPKQALILTGKADTQPGFVDPAKQRQTYRRYYLDMGINPDLFDFSRKTPYERLYVLSRSEIARFGLETRGGNYETPWTTSSAFDDRLSVMKSITRRTVSDPSEYLTFRLRFYCSSSGNVFINYRRETPLDPVRMTEVVRVTFGEWFLDLKSADSKAGIETGNFPSQLLDETLTKFAAAKTAFITEKGKDDAQESLEIKFSNDGLGRALSELRKECGIIKSGVIKTGPIAVPDIPHKPSPFMRNSS